MRFCKILCRPYFGDVIKNEKESLIHFHIYLKYSSFFILFLFFIYFFFILLHFLKEEPFLPIGSICIGGSGFIQCAVNIDKYRFIDNRLIPRKLRSCKSNVSCDEY